MTNILLGIAIGGGIVLIIDWNRKRQAELKIDELKKKNKELTGENYSLKTENAQQKVFISTIKDRVVMLEKRGDQVDTWFGSLLRRNSEQPFNKENIERLIAENKIFDDL